MGFNKVYKSLQEIFPQIDARVLRAVAIEHNKDVDAAVEIVLAEIIPFFKEKSRLTTPPIERIFIGEQPEDAIATTQTADDDQNDMLNVGNEQPLNNTAEPFYDSYNGHGEKEGGNNITELTVPGNILGDRMQMNIDVHSHNEAGQSSSKDSAKPHQIVAGESKTSETDSDDISESSISHSLGILQDEDNGTVENSHLETELTNHSPETRSVESDPQLEVLQDKSESDLEELDVSLPENTASKMETASNIVVGTEDESTLNASLSQSSQSNIIDALEEIIAEARNNKSVISLMREVELKEKAAEQAKIEAAMGGSDILVKSEELKEMVQQAEEANAMYSGEVYGEKAILGTELKELQSRVLSLSDERDNSLSVLNEMQQTLEVRLAEAQNEIKSAEEEKIEREKAAMKALADQELIMEKVVQESKILKQQAEDNAKLREFLVDRGRVVDMLQGEIGVICHDVRLLKENFDERVPFSKSLSSSQTSCILASSTSSSKSFIPDQVDERVDSVETQNKRDGDGDDDNKELVDDGWELM